MSVFYSQRQNSFDVDYNASGRMRGGVETPYSIYRWQKGDTVPSVDNLVILADIFDVAMDEIVVRREVKK